jgi:TPR repeat protein
MNIKSNFIKMLTISLLLFAQTAHADFRKALDALIKHNGKNMLHEVKCSVDKNDNDGLLLFISALNMSAETANKHYLGHAGQAKKDYIAGWELILSKSEQASLIHMLEIATKQHSLTAQYDLLPVKFRVIPSNWTQDNRKAIVDLEVLAEKGYGLAATDLYLLTKQPSNKTQSTEENKVSEKWLEKSANLGDPFANFALGMQLSGIVDINQKPCSSSSCQSINEEEGYARLKKALMDVRLDNPFFPMGDLSIAMGDLMRKGVRGQPADLHQACLWYLFGKKNQYDTAYYFSQVYNQRLDDMSNAGEIVNGCKELNEVWPDLKQRDLLIRKKQFELPALVKQKLESTSEPVFSVRRNFVPVYQAYYAHQYILDIYSNGQIKFRLGGQADDTNQEVVWKISSKEVEQIVGKIHQLHFEQWAQWNGGLLDDFDGTHKYTFSLRGKNDSYKEVHFINGGLTVDEKLRLIQLLKLIESHFNSQAWHCELGGDDYKKECHAYDKESLNLMK